MIVIRLDSQFCSLDRILLRFHQGPPQVEHEISRQEGNSVYKDKRGIEVSTTIIVSSRSGSTISPYYGSSHSKSGGPSECDGILVVIRFDPA